MDERLPPLDILGVYGDSKTKAEELVPQTNGRDVFWTVALRPAGIFGSVHLYSPLSLSPGSGGLTAVCLWVLWIRPEDRRATLSFAPVLRKGKSHFDITTPATSSTGPTSAMLPTPTSSPPKSGPSSFPTLSPPALYSKKHQPSCASAFSPSLNLLIANNILMLDTRPLGSRVSRPLERGRIAEGVSGRD